MNLPSFIMGFHQNRFSTSGKSITALSQPILVGAAVAIGLGLSSATSRLIWWVSPSFLGGVETGDKLVWAVILLLTLGSIWVALSANGARAITSPRVLSAASLTLLGSLGIGVITQVHHPGAEGKIWSGFGPLVFSVGLMVSLIAYVLGAKSNFSLRPNQLWIFLSIPFLIALAPSIVSLFVDPRTIDPYHSAYVLSDLFSPLVGNGPFGMYISQYSHLLGLPLLALEKLVGPLSEDVVVSYLVLLKVSTIVLLGVLSLLVVRRRFGVLALLVVMPIAFIKGTEDVFLAGQVTISLSAVPVRTLFLFILALFLLVTIGWSIVWRAFGLGLVSGLGILNNLEFGLVGAVACGLALTSLGRSGRSAVRTIVYFLSGILTMFLLVTALVWVGFGNLQLSNLLMFPLSFGVGGFGALPMPMFGAHYFLLPMAAFSVAAGFVVSKHASFAQINLENFEKRAVLGSIYFGTLTLLGFGYFVGRSVHSVQLQILLLFAGVAILSSAALTPVLRRRVQGANRPPVSRTSLYETMPIVFALSVAFSSIVAVPSFSSSIVHLALEREEPRAPLVKADAVQSLLNDEGKRNPPKLLLTFGNVIGYEKDLESLGATANPSEAIYLGGKFLERACSSLSVDDEVTLIVDQDGVALLEACDVDYSIASEAENLLRIDTRR